MSVSSPSSGRMVNLSGRIFRRLNENRAMKNSVCSVGFVFSSCASRKPSLPSWHVLCLVGLCYFLATSLASLATLYSPLSQRHLLREASPDTLRLGVVLSSHCLLNPGPTSIHALNSKNGTKLLIVLFPWGELTRVVSVFTLVPAHR